MELVNCGKGHFYDPNLYSSCPQCAGEMRNGGANGVEDYGATLPVFPHSGSADFDTFPPSVTKPLTGENSTMPPTTGSGFYAVNGPQIQEYGLTDTIPPVKSVTEGTSQMNPVVGWLVCVNGANKGGDYRIHNGYNYIGRGDSMDICIQGDSYISSERAAMISYDDEEKVFFFGPGSGHNAIRVNGKMIYAPVQLQPYDEVKVGMSLFRFVPFCGERFDWNE